MKLGGAKQRATLGFLLLQINRVVAVSELQEALWACDEAPPTARKVLQNAVWGLRGLLASGGDGPGAATVVTQAPGYMLRVAPEQVDLQVFHAKVGEGRARLAAGEPEQAVKLLGDALALWRGPALADLVEAGISWPEINAVQSAKLDAMEDYFDAQLACGRHHEFLGELTAMVANEPFRERSCGQLMLALYRCGRQVEALDTYRHLRSVLVRDLGLDPSSELQALQRAILAHEPALSRAGLPWHAGLSALSPGTGPTDGPALLGPATAAPEKRTEEAAPRDTAAAQPPAAPAETAAAAPVAPGAVATPTEPSGAPRAVPSASSPAVPAARTGAAERQDVSLVLVRSKLDADAGRTADPAAVDSLHEEVAAAVRRHVEDFDGTVAMSAGSLCLAAFGLDGAPGGAASAVRAALTIRDRFGGAPDGAGPGAAGRPGPTASLAVLTGEALVRYPAPGDGAMPTVFGALVDRAQCMVSRVAPGEIRMCERTRRAAGPAFVHRRVDRSPTEWEVTGVRKEPVIPPTPQATCELQVVNGLLKWTRHRGTAYLITVLGEPGSGKTRFLREFREPLTQDGASAEWLVGQVTAGPVATAAPAAARRAVRCGTVPDEAGPAGDRPPATVRCWGGTAAERARLAACLGDVFGAEQPAGAPSADRPAVRASWDRFLAGLDRSRPQVLIIDDVHRAADDVLHFVEELAEAPVSAPLFVVAAADPELLHRRPDWAGGKQHAATVTLVPPAPAEPAPDVVVPAAGTCPKAAQRASLPLRSGGELGSVPGLHALLGTTLPWPADGVSWVPPQEGPALD